MQGKTFGSFKGNCVSTYKLKVTINFNCIKFIRNGAKNMEGEGRR